MPASEAGAARFKAMGFELTCFENLQTRQVGSALREFRNLIRPGSVALFFYGGHGLQVRGENVLPTVDAGLTSEEDVPNQSLSLSNVLNLMQDSKAGVNLVLLAACRNNPCARNFRSAPYGLARVRARDGREHFLAYLERHPAGRFAPQARAALWAMASRDAQLEDMKRAEAEPLAWGSARARSSGDCTRRACCVAAAGCRCGTTVLRRACWQPPATGPAARCWR